MNLDPLRLMMKPHSTFQISHHRTLGSWDLSNMNINFKREEDYDINDGITCLIFMKFWYNHMNTRKQINSVRNSTLNVPKNQMEPIMIISFQSHFAQNAKEELSVTRLLHQSWWSITKSMTFFYLYHCLSWLNGSYLLFQVARPDNKKETLGFKRLDEPKAKQSKVQDLKQLFEEVKIQEEKEKQLQVVFSFFQCPPSICRVEFLHLWQFFYFISLLVYFWSKFPNNSHNLY